MDERPEDEAESRRILRDVDGAAHGFLLRSARDIRDRTVARDVDQNDPIEVWGTRIGRTVGVAALLILAVWFFSQTFGA